MSNNDILNLESIIYEETLYVNKNIINSENNNDIDIIIKDELNHKKYILQQKVMCDEYLNISYSIPKTWKDCILKCLIETKFSTKYLKIFKLVKKYLGEYQERIFNFTPKVIYPNIKNQRYSIKYFAENIEDESFIQKQEQPYYGLFLFYDKNNIILKNTFLRHELEFYKNKYKENPMIFIGEISNHIFQINK